MWKVKSCLKNTKSQNGWHDFPVHRNIYVAHEQLDFNQAIWCALASTFLEGSFLIHFGASVCYSEILIPSHHHQPFAEQVDLNMVIICLRRHPRNLTTDLKRVAIGPSPHNIISPTTTTVHDMRKRSGRGTRDTTKRHRKKTEYKRPSTHYLFFNRA